MTKNEVFELIDKRIKELNKPYLKFLEFYKVQKYLKENPYRTNEEILKIDIFKIAACFLYCSCGEKNIDYYYNLFNEIREYFESTDDKNRIIFYDELLNLFENIDKLYIFDNEAYCQKVIENANLVVENFETRRKHISAWKSVISLFKEKNIKSNNIICVLTGIGEFQITFSMLAFLKQKFGNQSINHRDLKKHYRDIINSQFKRILNLENGLQLIKNLDKYAYFIEQDEKKYNKERNKEILSLQELKITIEEKLQLQEIKDIKEITRNIRDEKIKKQVLILFYEHNMKYYQRIESELLEFKENQIFDYYNLLYKYGIVIDKDILRSIMHNSIVDLKKILEVITKYRLSNKDYISILQKTNLKIVNQIKEFINKGFLDINFINENIDMFYLDSNKLKKYILNINEVLKYELNPMLFKNNYNLLLSNNSLSKNLNILAQYNLIKGLKNLSNYSFLENNNLEEKIDLLIELNLFNILENNLDILNYDNLKRLELLKKMGYELNNIEEIRNYLEGRFFIQDNLIDTYLGNILEFIDEEELNILIDDLEIYKINDRTYEINGVLISVNKVKRKLEEGYSLYQAIIFNKKMTLQEYNKLIEELRKKDKQINL